MVDSQQILLRLRFFINVRLGIIDRLIAISGCAAGVFRLRGWLDGSRPRCIGSKRWPSQADSIVASHLEKLYPWHTSRWAIWTSRSFHCLEPNAGTDSHKACARMSTRSPASIAKEAIDVPKYRKHTWRLFPEAIADGMVTIWRSNLPGSARHPLRTVCYKPSGYHREVCRA